MTNLSDSNPRIYVACLAAYNSGYLHGVWIDAHQDDNQIRDEIAAMLARSPVEDAEEYAIHDSADDQLEAAMSRRLDKLGRQIDTLDLDLAVLGETVAQFIHFWMTLTPPLTGAAQSAARAKGAERFEGFMQNLGRRLATGDRFLKELSRDITFFEQTALDLKEREKDQ